MWENRSWFNTCNVIAVLKGNPTVAKRKPEIKIWA